jgi:hypothetical protein
MGTVSSRQIQPCTKTQMKTQNPNENPQSKWKTQNPNENPKLK